MKVTLMYGGRSGEHEISLISCASVIRNISNKHEITLISVSKDGKWYLEDSSVVNEIKTNPEAKLKVNANEEKRVSVIPGGGTKNTFSCNGKIIASDVVFFVMHGTYSEDGTLQGLFEMVGVPYVGSGVLGSAVSMDKVTTKIILEHSKIPIVPYMCITKADINNSSEYDRLISKAIETLQFPLFVKPCSAGSSDGASKATNAKELSFALMEAFSWDNKVLIEKAINAREVECSITGNSITSDANVACSIVKAYGPGEIVPKHDFYDYDAKYNDPDGAELKIPALLEEDKLEYIRDLAKKAYIAVNASGLARVDFFIDRDDGKIYLNEINTIPGFTSISMYPKMCESNGLKYSDLIDYLFEEALAEYKAKVNLCTTRE